MTLVEVTMNMAKYCSRRSEQPENVNFEAVIRGLDIFDWDQVKILFIYARFNCKRKKRVKMDGKKCP